MKERYVIYVSSLDGLIDGFWNFGIFLSLKNNF